MTTPLHWLTHPETDSDIPSVRRINLAAFETSEEADLVDALRTDPGWINGLSTLSTTAGGDAVGYALLSRCHIGDTAALCLGPCAVLPEYQRTGAGSAAIRAALDAARQQDERFVTVLGHPTYYPRFGFSRASVHGVTMRDEVPDDALMVLALDGSPIPTGVIRYAAPFGDI
ncbi:N-acetyltransferase [Mycobacterium sp. 21AC1]|uniref:GNAT family N-acetyltransferase n=1 Tax=[Mycobacterium] appelbergii TaxID=2939269 RepID=UPI00293902D9|nr:N-acetyltransferase [Mycobacterium sp. 21AC1]MDV3126605.1 N-acetyltransferase [Mycobacterium sp. 21AC1]